MYTKNLQDMIERDLQTIKDAGKLKIEHEIGSAQGATVKIDDRNILMFGSNNYIGLANHPDILSSARDALDTYGYGLSSVRFIAGTQTIHRELEKKLAHFLGVEDAILFSTNFMANLGFFATLVNESFGNSERTKDVIYSDELNHASLIDAFKLCKKDNLQLRVYPHADTEALERMLREDTDTGYRHKIIVTDGVFSMEGYMADLPKLKELAERYEALLFVDDAHGVGVIGSTGAGTPEYHGVHGTIDVLSGTFGKALGGAVGGYIAGPIALIDLLRQKSRTYTFSNSLPPAVVMASMKALDVLTPEYIKKVTDNAIYFRNELKRVGLEYMGTDHPIVPVLIPESKRSKTIQEISTELFANGLLVPGLSYPVVPQGTDRLRFQISAAHTKQELDRALEILISTLL